MTEDRRELIQAISEKLDSYPQLESLRIRHGLNLFNVLSPAVIVSVDREVSANPSVLTDSVCFLEITRHLSSLYAVNDVGYNFVDNCLALAGSSRYSRNSKTGGTYTRDESLHSDIMSEYFVEGADDVERLFRHNPVFFGLYIYILISSIVK